MRESSIAFYNLLESFFVPFGTIRRANPQKIVQSLYMATCLDQQQALDKRENILHRQLSLVSEAQLALMQAPRKQIEELSKLYIKAREELEATQKEIKELKTALELQANALDLMDRLQQIADYRPPNAVELYKEADVELKDKRDKMTNALMRATSESDNSVSCPIPIYSEPGKLDELSMKAPEEPTQVTAEAAAAPVTAEATSSLSAATEAIIAKLEEAEKPATGVPYFGYGSNMATENLEKRVGGKVKKGRKARLENYKLVFDKLATKTGNGFASIQQQPNDVVYGVVFYLTAEQLDKLDRFEGVPGHYTRNTMIVRDDEQNNEIEAQVYIGTVSRPNLKPSQVYLEAIIKGAEEYKFPESYINELKETETAEKTEAEQVKPAEQSKSETFRKILGKEFNEKDCPKKPSKGGQEDKLLRELAKKFGIDPKGIKKEDLCKRLAKLLLEK